MPTVIVGSYSNSAKRPKNKKKTNCSQIFDLGADQEWNKIKRNAKWKIVMDMNSYYPFIHLPRTSQHCEIVTSNETVWNWWISVNNNNKKIWGCHSKNVAAIFFYLADENICNDRSDFDIPILSQYSVSICAKQKTNTSIVQNSYEIQSIA